jgi:hypothetical protein
MCGRNLSTLELASVVLASAVSISSVADVATLQSDCLAASIFLLVSGWAACMVG